MAGPTQSPLRADLRIRFVIGMVLAAGQLTGCASVYPVTIKVIDSKTGTPVKDAEVSVESRTFTMLIPSGIPHDFPTVQTGKTDSEGEMQASLVTGKNFAVIASHPDYIENDRILPKWNKASDGQVIVVRIPPNEPATSPRP